MQEVVIKGKRFVPYLSQAEIERKIGDLAARLSADYAGDCPVLLVVLNGALPFAAALMQRMSIPLEMSCIKYKSYEGTESSGKIREVMGLPVERLKGRRVIVVEDIVDTGNTMAFLHERLKEAGVKDAEVATLTWKKGKYRATLPLRYVGFEIDDAFIIGYGMDYDELGRQYPDIYQFTEE